VKFLSERMLSHVLPEQRTPFGGFDAALLGLLVEMVGQDFERAAHARLEDIREMRALFAEARPIAGDDALVARMADALARDLSDLRIARLDEVHALHSAVLIELHARIETLGAPAAQLDRRVWEHLERRADRHRYDVNF
jgi:hypothetical protein